ncbi:ABC transporter substrate-binding protein [Brevibacterium aurantiacum]|uniref:Thiamine pyrimidine synthase n=1 Tax=Brevibacterium aurantiacum TaxID=273384 RepID=A0A556CAU4_BREAU|nr:ABC transporter substrate-binding protein [Brevibacterium aurantiacum]TSI14557.1 ABC transporter substrate-binding protein [Brevibacterium aurantiacum]
MDRYHVTATGHSLNYLPEYAAEWNGFFHDENIAYSVSVPSPWDQVLDDLRSGSAEAALGGIWVPSMYRGRADTFTPFAKIAGRAPLALLGRGDSKHFSVADTVGKTVLMKGSNGASVGLYFKMLLRENGIDPTRVNFIQDLDGAMLSELFVGGMGDYLLIDQLSAEHVADSNDVTIVFSAVREGGDIPWSVYYVRGGLDDANRSLHERFYRAIARGTEWILHHQVEEYLPQLVELFPGRNPELLRSLAQSFKDNGMWSTPQIDQKPYERWQKGIKDGHLIHSTISHDDFVDTP